MREIVSHTAQGSPFKDEISDVRFFAGLKYLEADSNVFLKYAKKKAITPNKEPADFFLQSQCSSGIVGNPAADARDQRTGNTATGELPFPTNEGH